MNKEKWLQIKQLYDQASALEPEKQVPFILESTEGDDSLRETLLSMLVVDSDSSADQTDSLTKLVSKNASYLFKTEFQLCKGDRIEQFVVDECIGEGGMGSVYLAHRQGDEFEQRVAIKVIHKQQMSFQSMQRFKQERQILATLNHKNIGSFIGGGETEEGLPYIILEYIEGVPITEYCQSNQLNLDQRLYLYKEVLSAVKYAHQNLVVHRDIKPSNVLVTKNGEVKLLDFGIAKLLQEGADTQGKNIELTQEDIRVLTPSSASPEQVLGQSVTTRSDVYGLGTLLMHLLTDEPVFDTTQRSTREIENMIIEQTPVKPSLKCANSSDPQVKARANQIKGDLDTIVLHTLQKDPNRRYSTVEQIEEDINRFQAHYPIFASPESRLYRCKKFIQRNTLTTVLSAFLVISLISFSALVSYQSEQIKVERDAALEQAEVAEETASFVADLFTSARVDQTSGEAISIQDILGKAKEHISELDTNQSTKAMLLLSLAQIYTTEDEFESALKLLLEAKSLLAEYPFKNPKTQAEYDIRIDIELGDTRMMQGNYKEAITLFEEILTRVGDYALKGLLDGEALILRYRAIEYSLAISHYYIADYEQQLVHLERAIEYASQSQTEPVPPIFYITKGAAMMQSGDYESARLALESSVELERETSDVPTLDLAYALNQLAATLELLGELDLAIGAAQEGFDIRSNIVGEAHVEAIASAGMLSNLYTAKGDYQQAIAIREQVLSAMEAADKTAHPYYAVTLGSLGNIYKQDGQFEKAKEDLVEAHRLLNAFFSDGHFEVARPLLLLAEVSLLEGNVTDAQDYLAKSRVIIERELNEEHNLNGLFAAIQSLVHFGNNEQASAKEQEELALGIYKRLYGVDHKRYKAVVKMLSLVREALYKTGVVNKLGKGA